MTFVVTPSAVVIDVPAPLVGAAIATIAVTDEGLAAVAAADLDRVRRRQVGHVATSCRGKQRLGRRAARRAARTLARQQGEQLHAYPCSGHWHVGHGIDLLTG